MEIDLLHQIWLRFSDELEEKELHHHDIVHFALKEIEEETAGGQQSAVISRLKKHLDDIEGRRVPQP